MKTLEARLRAAYVSKELTAQIAERRAAEAMEKVSQKDIKLKLLNEITYQMCSYVLYIFLHKKYLEI